MQADDGVGLCGGRWARTSERVWHSVHPQKWTLGPRYLNQGLVTDHLKLYMYLSIDRSKVWKSDSLVSFSFDWTSVALQFIELRNLLQEAFEWAPCPQIPLGCWVLKCAHYPRSLKPRRFSPSFWVLLSLQPNLNRSSAFPASAGGGLGLLSDQVWYVLFCLWDRLQSPSQDKQSSGLWPQAKPDETGRF